MTLYTIHHGRLGDTTFWYSITTMATAIHYGCLGPPTGHTSH